MPHVAVKLWPGKSDAQKRELSEAILRAMTGILGASEASVSIGIEEIAAEDWTEAVYEPEILGKWETLTRQPGYGRRPPDDRPPDDEPQ